MGSWSTQVKFACVSAHGALRLSVTIVATSKLHFLANKNVELARRSLLTAQNKMARCLVVLLSIRDPK